MARKLPKGIRENKGTYEARAMVNGVKICLYGSDLDHLIEEFHQAKEKVKNSIDYRKTMITLNEWFEEWFTEVKAHKVKETSIHPSDEEQFQKNLWILYRFKKIEGYKAIGCPKSFEYDGARGNFKQRYERGTGTVAGVYGICSRKSDDCKQSVSDCRSPVDI